MVLVQHREYIGDITSSATASALKITKYTINPGINTTFPWLADIANSFEEYVFTGLVFYFVTSSATAIVNGVNTNMGFIYMRFVHDALAATDTTIPQLQNSYGTVRGVPYRNLQCAVNTGSLSVNHLRTRISNPPTNSDLRMYDHGFLEVATSGIQGANTNIGQLWVAYDIHLVKPRINISSFSGQVSDIFLMGPDSSRTSTTDALLTIPALPNPGSTLGGTTAVVTGTLRSYVFSPSINQGSFIVTYRARGTTAANTTAPTFAGINCTLSGGYLLPSDGGQWNGPNNQSQSTASVTNSTFQYFVTVTASGASFSLGANVLPTGTQTCVLLVEPTNPNLLPL